MISMYDLAVEVNKPTDAMRVLVDDLCKELGEEKVILAYGGGTAETVLLSYEAVRRIRRQA